MLQKNIESDSIERPHGARLKPYSADFGGPRGGSKSRGCPGDPLTLQVWKPRPQPRLWFRVTAGDRALVSLVCPWFPHPFWKESVPSQREARLQNLCGRGSELRAFAGRRGAPLRAPPSAPAAGRSAEAERGARGSGARRTREGARGAGPRPVRGRSAAPSRRSRAGSEEARRATESRASPGGLTAAPSRGPGSFCPREPGGAEEACVPGDAVAGGRRFARRKPGICGPCAGNGARRATKL